MKTLVMKFGGAAVASPEQFSKIADIILRRFSEYSRIAVVVSAMGNTTDELIRLALKVNPSPPQRELDMLISVGERISISLLAMALSLKNKEAISFTGSQSGIMTCSNHTDAKIVDVRPSRLLPHLNMGTVVIVAGFQGVSLKGEITTLGRGGSDTSAVALGIALGAEKIEFYKDVAGIYSADPKRDPGACLYPSLSYNEALKLAHNGAKVLHSRCILLASRNAMPLHIQSFQDQPSKACEGTLIQPESIDQPRSLIYEGQ